MGDGGLSSYKVFIDGVAIGTFNSDGYANVCIRTTTMLANGSHTLTGNELAPHSTYTITPFSFLVDTVAPAAPSAPTLASWTDTGTLGDNTTSYQNVVLLGHATAGASVQAYAAAPGSAAKVVGGAVADSSGNYSIATTTLNYGTYAVNTAAVDEAGNKSSLSGTLSLTISSTTATTTTTASSTTTTTASSTTTTTKPTTTTTTTTMPATTTTTIKTTTTTTATTSTTTVPLKPPSAPTGLFAAPNKPHGIALGWTAPYNGGSSITAYRVYRSTSSGAETMLASIAPSTSYLDTTGAHGVVYYYRVVALNAIGVSPFSNEVSAQMR
jgi:hypothetical protein